MYQPPQQRFMSSALLDAAERTALLRIWLLPLAFVAVLVLVASLVDVAGTIDGLRTTLEEWGIGGLVAYAALFAIATTFLVSGTVLTVTAGVLFGIEGVIAVWLGAVPGALGGLLLARYVFSDVTRRFLHGRVWLSNVDTVMREEGGQVCLFLRLAPPIPFSALNWALGVTPIPIGAYLWSTAIGIIPSTFLYVWIGSLGQAALSGETGLARSGVLAAGALLTLILFLLIGRAAQRALERHEEGA